MSLPAHHTKHLPTLAYPFNGHTFHLAQHDDGTSNGTALWLGAQVLSAYLASDLKGTRNQPRRPRAVELGSGIGLTALALSSLGYDVLATDTAHVCDAVLRRNIAANLHHLPSHAGSIQVRVLDWTVPSEFWRWDDPIRITPDSGHPGETRRTEEGLLGPPFDLIVTSDTIYDGALVDPLFHTIRALSTANVTPPLVVIALERRDPQLINAALSRAPIPLVQVPTKKIRKSLDRSGIHWDVAEWEGVEVWRGSA